jgi:hypothetical protein
MVVTDREGTLPTAVDSSARGAASPSGDPAQTPPIETLGPVPGIHLRRKLDHRGGGASGPHVCHASSTCPAVDHGQERTKIVSDVLVGSERERRHNPEVPPTTTPKGPEQVRVRVPITRDHSTIRRDDGCRLQRIARQTEQSAGHTLSPRPW